MSLSGLLPAISPVFSSASVELESNTYKRVWYKMKRVQTNWTFSRGDQKGPNTPSTNWKFQEGRQAWAYRPGSVHCLTCQRLTMDLSGPQFTVNKLGLTRLL